MPYTSLYIQREKVRNPVNNLINGTRVLSIKIHNRFVRTTIEALFAAEKVVSLANFLRGNVIT